MSVAQRTKQKPSKQFVSAIFVNITYTILNRYVSTMRNDGQENWGFYAA